MNACGSRCATANGQHRRQDLNQLFNTPVSRASSSNATPYSESSIRRERLIESPFLRTKTDITVDGYILTTGTKTSSYQIRARILQAALQRLQAKSLQSVVISRLERVLMRSFVGKMFFVSYVLENRPWHEFSHDDCDWMTRLMNTCVQAGSELHARALWRVPRHILYTSPIPRSSPSVTHRKFMQQALSNASVWAVMWHRLLLRKSW